MASEKEEKHEVLNFTESNQACLNCRGANRGTKQEQRPLADYALQGRGNTVGVTQEENERSEVKIENTVSKFDTDN